AGEMPPKTAPQPKPGEARSIIDGLTSHLTRAAEQRKLAGGRTTLRRLNRVQYDRTVRDLLSLPDLLVDPTQNFPPDETSGQFDNIGSTLVMSDFLLQRYVEAADLLITSATSRGRKPEVRTYRFMAPFSPTLDRPDSQDVANAYQHIRKNTSDQGGHLWLEQLTQSGPH